MRWKEGTNNFILNKLLHSPPREKAKIVLPQVFIIFMGFTKT